MSRPTPQVKVLIAEKTLGMAQLIAKNLRCQGYSIAGIVNSAEKALEFAITTVPDVVLLDLPLHGEMDTLTAGWKILSEIHCPVIYMSAYPGDIVNQAETLNPHGFLLKPFTIDELRTTIEQTLEQHQHQIATVRNCAPYSFEEEKDEEILALLSLASGIFPPPQISFVNDCLVIYASTLEDANQIQTFCQNRFFNDSYQIFVWRWATQQYELYAQEL